MREFEHPNMANFKCPICRSSKDKPVVLVGIAGTEEGGNMQAEQIHTECFKLYCSMNGIEYDIESPPK